MKRVPIATVILALGFHLRAVEQSTWPALSDSEWVSMTPESLLELLEKYEVNDRTDTGLSALMLAGCEPDRRVSKWRLRLFPDGDEHG